MERGGRNQRVKAGRGGPTAGRPSRGAGSAGGGGGRKAPAAAYTSSSSSPSSSSPAAPATAAARGGEGGAAGESFSASGRRVVLATGAKVDAYELRQSPSVLLSDELVRKFVVEGYLALHPTALPAAFHRNLYARTHALNSRFKDNVGNNILPTLPELDLVFDDPTVRGALQSILGPEYMMHAHRHCHDRRPGSKAQEWHKDSYWGFDTQRHHYPRWLMAMYYPQDTTLELGPTGLLPGTQYNALTAEKSRHLKTSDIPLAWDTAPYPATCPAGTVVLIHYDLWHAGLENFSTDPSKPRFMFKFQFVRMQEPKAPSWSVAPGGPSPWLPEHSSGKALTPLYQDVWDWMCGRRVDSSSRAWASDEQRQRTIAALFNTTAQCEVGRLAAAYTLAQKGDLEPLLQGFTSSEFCVMRTATYGLIAAARHSPVAVVSAIVENLKSNEKKKLHEAMPAYAVFALGDIGSPDAVEPLGKLLTHVKAVNVKRAIAEALGNIYAGGDGQESTLVTITECLLRLSADGDAQTRFQATMSLAKVVGSLPSASAAERPELVPRVVRTLSNALFDNNRYVQAYAIEGLKRMRGCPEAQDLLIRTLSSQRWCPITNKDSAF